MAVSGEVLGFLKTHHHDGVLSVYINSTYTDPAKRFVWQKKLRDGLRRALPRANDVASVDTNAYEQCAAYFEKIVPDADTFAGKAGWMCLCAANGDSVESWLSIPPADIVTWDVGPQLFPYLKATQSDEAVIVLVDLTHARILRMIYGQLTTVESHDAEEVGDVGRHMGDTPRTGFHTGTRGETATDAAQRQRRESQDRLLATVRKRLVALAGEKQPVIIGGSNEATAHLVSLLPGELLSRTEVATALRQTTPQADIPEHVHTALTTLHTRQQRDTLSALDRQSHINGHSLFGMDAVNVAASAGAVAHLLISESLVHENRADAEHLLRQALLSGARVEIATPGCAEALDSVARGVARGVAAELRFPVSVEALSIPEVEASVS